MDATELRALSLLLGAPDASALEAVRDMAAELRWLEEAVDELAQLPLDEWQGEHTRLFIAGHPHTPCPPFASVWLEKRMHGGPMEALQFFYGRIGLASAEMPADFLGTLLECAALLADDPDRTCLHEQLWRDHLLPWLPVFSKELARESRLTLYRAVARRLDDLCNEHGMATAAFGA